DAEIDVDEIDVTEIRVDKDNVGEIGADEIDIVDMSADVIDVGEIGADETNAEAVNDSEDEISMFNSVSLCGSFELFDELSS
ncbi:unnamed protein product, partial [Rotaria magnacalcarata]